MIQIDRSVLLDTNILLRSAQPSHPMCAVALAAQAELRRANRDLCVVSQNLVEFRAVATRPLTVNGLGMSEQAADLEVARIEALYTLHLDLPGILGEWKQLVSTHGAVGKQNHDARIAAAMRVHGIPSILTFNGSDFNRYPGIDVLDPREVMGMPLS